MPGPAAGSRARVYAEVNSLRSREYWDYEAYVPSWAAAAAAASPSATPTYYQLINEGRVEGQFYWNGQTIPLVGGYQAYAAAPMPTPAKVEEKPLPRRAPKKPHSSQDSDEEQGCSPPQIRRLEPSAKKTTTQKLGGRAMSIRRAQR